jgi:pimeloyl-ACP methyl ester carboxylesterase
MPTIPSNQTNLYYEEQGEGPTLVFIHGLGSSTRDWEYQVPEFARHYRVITFDLRGHGQSDKPAGPYTMPMLASDLAGLLKGLQLSTVHLAGMSLGGGVAFQFVLDHPEMVKTLTIINSGPSLGGTPEQAKQEVERRAGIVKQLGMRAMGEALSPALFPKPEHVALRETFVARWAENDPQAYIEATRSMLGWNVTDQLGSIACPTLILAADQDYSPVAAKEAYTALIPNAQLVVIPDAHHALPLECPEKFNAALAGFLAEHP